jgi:L,D-transpeptidase ErfK/SrfK
VGVVPVKRCVLSRVAAGLLTLAWVPAAQAETADDLLGTPSTYVTVADDTLLDIAVGHDLGYVEIVAANPGVDPWLPGAGQKVVLPTQHILPDAPRHGIVINLPELRLYYFPAKGPPMTVPIGIGGEGFETPVGATRVVRKQAHPTWIPTASEHAEEPDLPEAVPPGPDNPMGDYALYLAWSGYAIHGTNRQYSIGRRDSHGCIRLYPRDIEALFQQVRDGTPVTVVDQPVKLGWREGELYLEIHPEQAQADFLESHGETRQPAAEGDAIDDLVVKAAGADALRLDWYAIHLAENRQDGVAVRVTKPRQNNPPD